MRRCWTCETEKNLKMQLCGFWFCHYCLQDALRKGASYWQRLYQALYPWR